MADLIDIEEGNTEEQALLNAKESIAFEQERNQFSEQQNENLDQLRSEEEDPRNREGGGGWAGFTKELSSAVGGGLQDTGSSIVTFPERIMDMFNGEMKEEQATDAGYDAESDNWFVNENNPIETKTWWGGAIRSLVHFGTLAAAIIPAAKALGIGAAATVTGSLVRGAAYGATADVLSKYSQEDNGLAILRDRFNFIDTPLATKDTDHPAMKTLKNVVEGMGIGAVFDGAAILIGKGRKALNGNKVVGDGAQEEYVKALRREDSVNEQISEKAFQQLQYNPEAFGAYKNKPMAQVHQGNPTSNGKPVDVKNQLSRIRNEWGAEMGSTDSLHTPIQLQRTARSALMADREVARVLEDFMSDTRIQVEVAKAKKNSKKLSEIWGESALTAKRIFEGRNTSEVTAAEFWEEMFDAQTVIKEGTPEEIRIWDPEKVAAADLVIGSLMREIRDTGIAGRELAGVVNLGAMDGPVKDMYDKVIAGLTQIKLSKMKTSGQLRAFQAGQVQLKDVYSEVNKQVDESIEAFRLALNVAGNDKDDSLFKAIWETISMSDEIHNITDFDAWIRKKLTGGQLNGKVQTGALVKELQGVMINSVLSGPKTPIRAIMGTGTATFLRPLSQILGAFISGDGATRRSSLAALSGMVESIPEAWKLFRSKLNSYWTGDVANYQTRNFEFSKGDHQWQIYEDWVNNSGRASLGDKAAFNVANMARALNNNSFVTYSTKIMAATDDTFGYIMARARAKEKAMREAMNLFNKGQVTEITPDLLKTYQDKFFSTIMDDEGNITDALTLNAKKEATLTTELEGFAKALDDAFESAPWAKPFFLFARTGVNGIKLTAKHMPLLNRLVKESSDIINCKFDNLASVQKYGINSIEDLQAAKALQKGRVAIGSSIVFMASMHFTSGGLTGNGPIDRQKRRAWLDSGYKPRTITIGGVQIGYDAFEPFNLILSTIADIGDYSQMMGEEWTENQLQKVALVIAQGVSSKSYLAGLQQFVDLFAGQEGSWGRIGSGLLNNQIPLSSLRNELGKLFNPYMKELNSGIIDSIRNRNLAFEYGPGTDLPIKYDLLNGNPIKDWDFPTRMFNMFSPVSINLDQNPGRKLLFESGYDMRMSTYSSPDGLNLSNSPQLRSLFQEAIGSYNLEAKLNELALDPKILASLAQMQRDIDAGRRVLDPMLSYYHNKVIAKLFREARKQAWNKIRNHPLALELYAQEAYLANLNKQSLEETTPLVLPYR